MVDYDDAHPFFIFFIQHAWISLTQLETSFLHLVHNFFPKLSCCLNQSIYCLLQNQAIFFVNSWIYHFIIPFWNLHLNLMLQISIQKGIVNVYHFPFQFFNDHACHHNCKCDIIHHWGIVVCEIRT